MSIHRIPAVVLAAAALTGCGQVTTVGGSSPTVTSSVTATSTIHPTTGISACKAEGVRITWAAGGAAAGTDFGYVVVTNTGKVACELRGVPTLVHIATSGEAVGAASISDASVAVVTPIRLEPGKQAAAEYGDGNALNYPAAICTPVAVPGISVTLPGDNRQTALTVPGEACANGKVNALTVKPFTTDPINPGS